MRTQFIVFDGGFEAANFFNQVSIKKSFEKSRLESKSELEFESGIEFISIKFGLSVSGKKKKTEDI